MAIGSSRPLFGRSKTSSTQILSTFSSPILVSFVRARALETRFSFSFTAQICTRISMHVILDTDLTNLILPLISSQEIRSVQRVSLASTRTLTSFPRLGSLLWTRTKSSCTRRSRFPTWEGSSSSRRTKQARRSSYLIAWQWRRERPRSNRSKLPSLATPSLRSTIGHFGVLHLKMARSDASIHVTDSNNNYATLQE
jgi:hypothetical protein